MSFFPLQRLGVVLACGLLASPAAAQTLGSGTRALGMGQAFVAVADDASAVLWNPAGLATGALASAVVEGTWIDRPGEGQPGDPGAGAGSGSGALVALGLPPVGLSYSRLRIDALGPGTPAGQGAAGRDLGETGSQVRSLLTHNVGVTLLQSLTDALVVGTTVRVVRGGGVEAAALAGDDWDAALDRVDDLDRAWTTTIDVDLGAMATIGRFRAGLLARNLAAPEFDVDGSSRPFRLDRHVRAGVAYGTGWPGTSPLVVALDADLTAVPSPSGDRRDVAAGVEGWLADRRVGLRGGVRVSGLGQARPVAAGGLSVAVKSGVFVEGHVAAGGDGAEKSWGLGARIAF